MQTFNIEVWFVYTAHGELEKDYQIHKIDTNTVQEAINIAFNKYDNLRRRPIGIYHDSIKYSPDKT